MVCYHGLVIGILIQNAKHIIYQVITLLDYLLLLYIPNIVYNIAYENNTSNTARNTTSNQAKRIQESKKIQQERQT
jgi:hypothetical protein